MKTFLLALALAAACASPAAAQTANEIDRAMRAYRYGQCLLDRADEVRGAAARPLLMGARNAFDEASRIVNPRSPEPGRWTWVASSAGAAVAESRLGDPAFAPGAPSFSSSIFCEGAPIS